MPWRHFAPIALVVLLVFAIPEISERRAPHSKDGAAWADVAARIDTERRARDGDAPTAVIYGPLSHGISSRLIDVAYPYAFEGMTDVTRVERAADAGTLWDEEEPLRYSLDALDESTVVYLVMSRDPVEVEAHVRLLNYDGWTSDHIWELPRARVERWVRD